MVSVDSLCVAGVGPSATSLVGWSTVLALPPGPERFENPFATVLANQYSADELRVGTVSDLAIRRLSAARTEDLQIHALHGNC